jgi:hypothetical protein
MRNPTPLVNSMLQKMQAGEIDPPNLCEVLKVLDINELRVLGREMLKASCSLGTLLETVRAEISARRFLSQKQH